MLKPTSMLSVALLLSGPAAVAGEPPGGEEELDLGQIISAMSGKLPVGMPEAKAGLPDFKVVTKDMKSDKGLFTLWYYPPTAK
ncbi:MAG: hypothetical protein ACYS0G_03615, partial [Planctomycetota bacterium]